MLLIAHEHFNDRLSTLAGQLWTQFNSPVIPKIFRRNGKEEYCFKVSGAAEEQHLNTNYFVGVDWLLKDKISIYVEPKLNNEHRQIDFLSMLFQSLQAPENLGHLEDLYQVDFEAKWIPIPQQKDLLSPLLITQFIKLLQQIAKKGLKKSYYKVRSNLRNKLKGKIIVSRQLRENVYRNRPTHTFCEYQEFGYNFAENQFLKTVFHFVKAYVHQECYFFAEPQKRNLLEILNFCEPSFFQVSELADPHKRFDIKKNVFYSEYPEAIRIGRYILQRFSFNIKKTSLSFCTTPPFWIDMSKLFELYVFGKLKAIFPEQGHVSYHDKFKGGKETDILLKHPELKAVIDCKYKPRYLDNDPSLEDKRQLAGYTRLKSVYDKLDVPLHEVVKGLIIYSNQSFGVEIKKEELFQRPIKEYVDFYKLGVALPSIFGAL